MTALAPPTGPVAVKKARKPVRRSRSKYEPGRPLTIQETLALLLAGHSLYFGGQVRNAASLMNMPLAVLVRACRGGRVRITRLREPWK